MQIQPHEKWVVFFPLLVPLVRNSGWSFMGSSFKPNRMCLIQRRVPAPKRLNSKQFWRKCICSWRWGSKRAVTDALDCWQQCKCAVEHTSPREIHLAASLKWGENKPRLTSKKPKHLSLYLLFSAYFLVFPDAFSLILLKLPDFLFRCLSCKYFKAGFLQLKTVKSLNYPSQKWDYAVWKWDQRKVK